MLQRTAQAGLPTPEGCVVVSVVVALVACDFVSHSN